MLSLPLARESVRQAHTLFSIFRRLQPLVDNIYGFPGGNATANFGRIGLTNKERREL